MDVAAAVAAASPIIFKVGGTWFFDSVSRAKAAELGIKGYPFYFAARSGVLGDVSAPTVVAAFSFFEPSLVTKQFGNAVADHTPSEIGRAGVDALAEWGRAKFSGIDSAARTAELGRRIIEGVGLFGHTLFAAWREVAVPADGPAALALTIQTMRELRGDCHVHACAAVGLTPIEAMISRDGAERAQQFGWPEPYPEPGPLAATRAEAEELTDRQMRRFYGVLSEGELDEFVAGIRPTEAAASS
jgi:hypothetical protein